MLIHAFLYIPGASVVACIYSMMTDLLYDPYPTALTQQILHILLNSTVLYAYNCDLSHFKLLPIAGLSVASDPVNSNMGFRFYFLSQQT